MTRPDGDWCFTCGDPHSEEAANFRVVGIGHTVGQDRSTADLLDLGPNEEAERESPDHEWVRSSF